MTGGKGLGRDACPRRSYLDTRSACPRIPRKGQPMNFAIEVEREEDGRWLAEVPELPGVLAYGATAVEATARVKALALRVVSNRLEHGEAKRTGLTPND